MGDYIRGKKAYTKWDADSENIDIEYRPDAQKKQMQDGWLSGTKGKVIKVLLVLLVFCIGLIMGFFLRRGIPEVVEHTVTVQEHSNEIPPYSSDIEREKELLSLIKAENIKAFLQNYTSEPHIAGKPANKKYAEHIVELWKSWGIQNVHIEKFSVTLSYPSSETPNKVHLINSKDNNTFVYGTSEPGDDEIHPNLRPYLAYSPNGFAKGKLVYVHYGRREDFEYLHNNKSINVTGCIAIMRMGRIHIANKIKNAEDFGIVGALLYPDPIDYVNDEPLSPDGLGLPGDGIIRGSLNYLPGDPFTPMQPAIDSAYRLDRHMKFTLPAIPVQPIGYYNAEKFMANMTGPKVDDTWKGGLNISYAIGPGHIDNDLYVEITSFNELKEEEIFNVLGNIKGKFEPDRYVILGNHYDSWTNGTGDPGSGLAAFMEMVRAFGEFAEKGWSPGRTLVFALWDAEEFGMIGSTEWLELHRQELASRALAYINTDSAIEGRDTLQVKGSPLLLQTFTVAAKQHSIERIFHHWLTINHVFAENTEPELGILGSGSDYAGFMNGYGISSLHLQFVNKDMESDYKLSHSAYDNFDAFEKYIDPKFEMSVQLAELLASIGLQLSDTLKLPMNTEDYGSKVKKEFDEFEILYSSDLASVNISLEDLKLAIEAFNRACFDFHNNFNSVNEHQELLGFHEYNDRAMELERSLLLPRLDSIYDAYRRHALFGPHPDNNNEGVFFPKLLKDVFKLRRQQKGPRDDQNEIVIRLKIAVSEIIACLYGAVGVLSSSVIKYM